MKLKALTNICWRGGSEKLLFENLIEDWISMEVLKKYFSKGLAISMGSAKVALLSMMGIGKLGLCISLK